MQVLIVASQHDLLAAEIAAELKRRSKFPKFVDGLAAARIFTIECDNGIAHVSPNVQMFVRPSAWWFAVNQSSDARFAAGEAHSMLWAAAALSEHLVINRPSSDGWVGPLSVSSIAEVWRAMASDDGPELGEKLEAYVSGPRHPSLVSAGTPSDWGEDLRGHVGPLSSTADEVPLRTRSIGSDERFVHVTVVGSRVFIPEKHKLLSAQRDAIFELTIKLVRAFGFYFAAVTWSVVDRSFRPVRIEPNVDAYKLGPVKRAVIDALCEDLAP